MILACGLAAAGASTRPGAEPSTHSGVTSGQTKSARKTTDPPVPSHGKLGQDLFLAIDHRDLAGVRSLIKRGADPNARNGLEFTPLYIAAASHQADVMQALLGAGAQTDADSSYGTALTFAASSANLEGARLLLSRKASVDAFRSDGITVLMMAANAGSPELVSELLKHKADVNATDGDGATALSYAARGGHLEAGRILLAAGAHLDAADSHGQTPLMAAAVTGHADFVQMLLQKGAKPNARDSKGRTALILAAAYGDYPDVVHALLGGGANPKAKDSKGRTAAALAAARGYQESLAQLGDTSQAAGAGREPREAVRVSLKLIQSSMLQFNHETTCLSCHQDGLGRMATGAARERGFSLDPAVQQAQVGRITGMLAALQPLHTQALKDPEAMKQLPLIEINEVNTLDTWLLAGMAAHGQAPNGATAAMAMVLARQQARDGYWSFSVPRVPMQSSFFTFTALAVRSLEAYGPKSDTTEISERIGRARTWLLNAPTRNSEDRASRLLGLHWAGADRSASQKAVDEVRADQRPDGGWAQLPGMQSDAYATGQALYALHVAGDLPVDDPVYQRGVKFLLRTQDDDGSWFVNKRAIPANNYFDAGFPHGESQYASFNGTCWATMALLQTIDRMPSHASRR